MTIDTQQLALTKRRVILRDSLTFVGLIAITSALFAVTLFLFRSFQAHRVELATRWSDRGLIAFRENHPDVAVSAYRTALSYAPGKRSYELMLAEALGQAGRTEESYNYFTGLWETTPGDGFINLQLARLAAKRRDVQGAVNFYRASVYGTWEGDGVERRREVRLELARYLIQQHQLKEARAELLIAAGNAPDLPELDVAMAGLLEMAEAPSDALVLYRKALVNQPKNSIALSRAGQLAYTLGDYAMSSKLLGRAAEEQPANEADIARLSQAQRILELEPSETLPVRDRVDRILMMQAIAKKRLDGCTSSLDAPQLQELLTRWTDEAKVSRTVLLHDGDRQKSALQLIGDTEIVTSQRCSTPTGDDALILLLARSFTADGASHS